LQKSKNVIPEVLNRESSSFKINDFWIPAFAGMTDFRHKNILLQEPPEIENCYPIKSPLSKGVRGLSFPLPLREGERGRGKKRGNSFRISKSGLGFDSLTVICGYILYHHKLLNQKGF